MSEWKECKLGDVAEFKNGKSRPNEIANAFIPIYGGNGILGYTDKFNCQSQTVVIGRVGAYCGSVFFENKQIWVSDNALYALPKDNIDVKFLYYLLKNMDLNTYAEGSSHPLLTQTLLNSLVVFVPESISEHNAIATILSCLDDKIDLLHRQNKTLEAIAAALWRKMFIEEAEVSWEEASLLELIYIVGGGTPKTDIIEFWNGIIPWISAKDITANHKGFIMQTEKNITEMGLNSSATKFLPKYATVISARGTVGNYCMLASPMAFSQTNYGVLPKFEDCYFFTYLLIANVVAELKAAAYGSIFDTITMNTFNEQTFRTPPVSHVRRFENNVKPYFNKIYYNSFQVRTLTYLRDTLLPQLISGTAKVILESEGK